MHDIETPDAAQEKPVADTRPEYQPPLVVTYRGQQILEELGPAQACSFNHSVILGC